MELEKFANYIMDKFNSTITAAATGLHHGFGKTLIPENRPVEALGTL